MKIVFVHPQKAFLPEVEAYQNFFSALHIETMVAKPGSAGNMNADVEWHFMGTDMEKRKHGAIRIHEYASASTGTFQSIKNHSKKILSAKPDYRLFLNEYVKKKFRFTDKVPFGFRDMGVSSDFLHFNQRAIKKEFDFVYAGSVSADRKINKLLQCFSTGGLKNKSLLVISRHYGQLAKNHQQYSNIRFAGAFAHSQMPVQISRSRFAIDFRVDEEPHNQQTSTKLLEYAALRIPVITSNYKWVRAFQKKCGGNFFYLDEDLSNFTWENISSFAYSFPDLSDWRWENQIRKSGVLEFLGIA
ncbi:MAG: hypothetical protein JST47_12820 [Bacteroidetes bacterium]|nr:hypothetical protein [Bacteroidota bacterium]